MLAAGVGVTGLPVVRYLAGTGAAVVVSSNRPAPPELAAIAGDVTFAGDLQAPPDGTTLVVTSAGIPPTNPLLAAAAAAGIEVIGEVELAWRIDQASGAPAGLAGGHRHQRQDDHHRDARIDPAGRRPAGHGQRQHRLAGDRGGAGRHRHPDRPDEPRQDVIAVELSSFQLHWAPVASGRPPAWC